MARKLRDDNALQSALLRFGDTAFRITYMHTKSPKTARELLEDVFLQYCLRTKPFKNEAEERLWLLREVHKTCMDYYAAKLRRNPADEQIKHAGRNLDFIITDELCSIMKLPYTRLTALAVCCGDGESAEYGAKICGRTPAFVRKAIKSSAEKLNLSEEDLCEWIQTVYMPDDIRSRIQYNIHRETEDKHFAVNSRAKAFKRSMDRAAPYAALGVVCFGIFAVAAVRFGWLGVEYVRTPKNSDLSQTTTSSGSSTTPENSTVSTTQDGDAATLTLAYFVPDGDSMIRHNCTMEADASVLIAKMAENGVFPSDVTLNEVRFLKNGKVITSLKSGEMPDVQLYFSAALQTAIDSGDGEAILEAVSRTILVFYEAGNITPAKLEIFADGRPVAVNGEEINCTPLMYGETPVSTVVED